jgi:hypothetical protein
MPARRRPTPPVAPRGGLNRSRARRKEQAWQSWPLPARRFPEQASFRAARNAGNLTVDDQLASDLGVRRVDSRNEARASGHQPGDRGHQLRLAGPAGADQRRQRTEVKAPRPAARCTRHQHASEQAGRGPHPGHRRSGADGAPEPLGAPDEQAAGRRGHGDEDEDQPELDRRSLAGDDGLIRVIRPG